jgi:hypothetical protein
VTRLGAVVLAALLVAACGPGPLVRRERVNDDALDAVRRGLPAVRGLAFTAAVGVEALGPTEVRAAIAREIDETYRPGDLERLEAVYARLGLLPAGTSLRVALQRLYEEEGAGFYDPRRKRLVLATRAVRPPGFGLRLLGVVTGRDFLGEFVAAHELTHALQDQHWGLPIEPEPLTAAHGDRVLARRALLEGDATVAGLAYVAGGTPDRDAVEKVADEVEAVPERLRRAYPDVPEVVRTTLAFQYQAGTRFVARALARGGWPAVDAAHADPPASSEQVLHPARYFDVRDHPVDVTLGGTQALEAAGWRRVLEDTVGELQMRVLAGRTLAQDRAVDVAEGWGGDRLRALQRGDALVLVWLTAWDSPADAEDFAGAVPAFAPDARVERRADAVLVLFGPPGVDLARLAGAVWSETRTERPARGRVGPRDRGDRLGHARWTRPPSSATTPSARSLSRWARTVSAAAQWSTGGTSA